MGGLQSYFNALPLFSRYLLASGGIAMLASVITAYRITKVLALAPYFVVRYVFWGHVCLQAARQ
eukprot:scaffold3602_cov407-Prasinococcus_capsulatus_cf.AAC.3